MAVLFCPPRNSAIHPTHRCQHPMCMCTPTSTTAFTPTMKLTECQRNADADKMYSPIRRRKKTITFFSVTRPKHGHSPQNRRSRQKTTTFLCDSARHFYATVSSILRNGGRHSQLHSAPISIYVFSPCFSTSHKSDSPHFSFSY